MAYADYTFYRETYKGQMREEDFAIQSERASEYIDFITRNRAHENDFAVQMACCAVAEEEQTLSEIGDLSSVTTDGLSMSFGGRMSDTGRSRRLYQAAEIYLASAGLLYMGV